MEWLFFVTKISFMDVLSFFEKLGVLFNSGFFISLFMWFVVIVLFPGFIKFIHCVLYWVKTQEDGNYHYNNQAQ